MQDDSREAQIKARAGEDGPVRRRILAITDQAAGDWGRAPDAVARGLREARDLSSAERRFVGDAVHELIRHRRRLAHQAGSDAPAALYEAWLCGAILDGAAVTDDPCARIALVHSYPDWMVERFITAFGAEAADRLCAAMNRRAPLTVRANRLKSDRDGLAARLASDGIESSPTRLARDGLTLHTRQNVYEMSAFRDGWMELQDEGSQLCAELVAPPPRGTVVDACAGAGGKTLAIGALLQNRGRIAACDISDRKLEELRRRARRAGLTTLQAALTPAGTSPAPSLAPADRVLVDAPCSGLGVIRRHPETKWRVGPGEVARLARRQRAILEAYLPLVKPGGRLIYATCSLSPEENDGVIDGLLADHPELAPVSAKEVLGKERALAIGDGERLRVRPDLHDTDGFFAAIVRRRA